MSDDGVWVGWSLDEDGEPGDWYDASIHKALGPRIRLTLNEWAEWLKARRIIEGFNAEWRQHALEEQRDWDERHPPPPLSPEMQVLRDVMQDVVERTLAKSLAFAGRVDRDYDKPKVGRTVDVRLPARYRPK